MWFLSQGFRQDATEILEDDTFKDSYDNMVIVKKNQIIPFL